MKKIVEFSDVKTVMDAMQQLNRLGVGTHYCGWFNGYIHIEGNDDKFNVMWTSDKNTHDILSGSAILVQFTKNGHDLIFKSALTMHIVRYKNEQVQCVKFIEKRIAGAFNNKFSNILMSVFNEFKTLKYSTLK